jgi:hypothetical protein
MLGWALTRANHWDVLTNQYIIHGVKYSASFFDTLACKNEGAFLFKREGDTVTFIAFDASEKTTQDEIDDSDSVESDELVDQRAVSRGGAWYGNPKYCRSAFRFHAVPDGASDFVGFRVCCPSAKKSNLPQKITSINNEVSRLVSWLVEHLISPQKPLRGGSWHTFPKYSRSTFRSFNSSALRFSSGGFRACHPSTNKNQ